VPPFPPIEPPPTEVRFPDPQRNARIQVVAVGCDFRPGTILTAYRAGIFPWPHGDELDESGQPLVAWFSPSPRAVFPLEAEPHWSRSLRRTLRRHPFEITLDEDFAGVMQACGETRPSTWIIPELVAGYHALHELGWAHSLEVWERGARGRELVGGIYGLSLGRVFAGESMFHKRTDASKIAFASLVGCLRANDFSLFDVQVMNPHLLSLGCVNVPRATYIQRLKNALESGPAPLRLV
jgi:leucyl/phenylalanyl-tRNA--protein transferase